MHDPLCRRNRSDPLRAARHTKRRTLGVRGRAGACGAWARGRVLLGSPRPVAGTCAGVMAQARAEEVGPEEGSGGDEEGASSVAADYVTIYKMMSPSFDGPPLSREQLCRLLPLATGMQFFWVLLFMIVELSGGAGGTSGVAGTRTVTLFVVYIILIVIALLIARASAAGSLKNSALVSSLARAAFVLMSPDLVACSESAGAGCHVRIRIPFPHETNISGTRFGSGKLTKPLRALFVRS